MGALTCVIHPFTYFSSIGFWWLYIPNHYYYFGIPTARYS